MTDKPISVSVIIPSYNRARSIGDAIHSVLNQSHAPDQVIVVNDGSTDQTEQALSCFGQSIEIVTQANMGVAAARNSGCRQAVGDWLTFLDSDDLWAPDRLAIFHRDVQGADAQIVAHLADVRMTGPGYSRTLFEERQTHLPRGCAALVADPLTMSLPGISTISAAIRRSAFEQCGGFDRSLTIYEDLQLFCMLALAGKFLATGDVVAQGRRLDGDNNALTSLERQHAALTNANLVRAYTTVLEHAALDEHKASVSRSLSGARMALARAQWETDRREAFRNLYAAARVHPSIMKGSLKSLLPIVLGKAGFNMARRSTPSFDRS